MFNFSCWDCVWNLSHQPPLCLWLTCTHSTAWMLMLTLPALIANVILPQCIITKYRGVVTQGCRGTQRSLKLKKHFLPSAWEVKLYTRKQRNRPTPCQLHAHTSRAVSCSYFNPDCSVGCGPRLLVIGPNFHLTPSLSVVRYSLGWAPKLKWLICSGLTGEWEGEVIYIVCGEA